MESIKTENQYCRAGASAFKLDDLKDHPVLLPLSSTDSLTLILVYYLRPVTW